jgi:hypothetical protein
LEGVGEDESRLYKKKVSIEKRDHVLKQRHLQRMIQSSEEEVFEGSTGTDDPCQTKE